MRLLRARTPNAHARMHEHLRGVHGFNDTHLTVSLRVPAWRPGRVRQGPFLRASFWRGLSFSIQSVRTALAARACTRLYVLGLYVTVMLVDSSLWHGCLVCQKWHDSSHFIAF